MKRLFVIILSACLLLTSLTACGTKEKTKPEDTAPIETNEDQQAGTPAEQQKAVTPTEDNPAEETPSEIEPVSETTTSYPVVIENFEQSTEYTQAPEKVVALTLNSAEMLAALGVSDVLVGMAQNNNAVEDVLPEYYPMLKEIPLPEEINAGIPTLEGLLGLTPELVVANSYYFKIPFFGTMEDYANNNVKFYVTEGSYIPDVTIENTYNDIRNLGTIFAKEQEAEKLIAGMQNRITEVGKKVKELTPVKVMLFDSINEGNFCVAGGSGLAQNLVELAGGQNIFQDSEAQFPVVGIEEVIARDPDVIVVHNYSRDPQDAQSKIDFLKNSKDLENVSAVKNDRIIVITLFAVNPGLQNVDAVEQMAKALHPDAFSE